MFERKARLRGDWIDVVTFMVGAGWCVWAATFGYAVLFGIVASVLVALALAHLLGPIRRGASLLISPAEMTLVLRTRRVVRPEQVQAIRMAEGNLMLRLRDDSTVTIPPELDPAAALDYLRIHWKVEVR